MSLWLCSQRCISYSIPSRVMEPYLNLNPLIIRSSILSKLSRADSPSSPNSRLCRPYDINTPQITITRSPYWLSTMCNAMRCTSKNRHVEKMTCEIRIAGLAWQARNKADVAEPRSPIMTIVKICWDGSVIKGWKWSIHFDLNNICFY